MTSFRYRSFSFKVIFITITLVILIPLYMYFSQDVERLNKEYPHIFRAKSHVSFTINKGSPRNWIKLKDISYYARSAIVLSEDWSFFDHNGFDPEQMKMALSDMIYENRYRGASTITQQMIKNIYLSNSRTFWRKIYEIILSYKIERYLSKNRILEIYLNIIEFGPNIYGIRDASYHYFKKSPSEIGPREAAFLAMLLPSPKKYYLSYRTKKLTPFAKQRVEIILEKMRIGKVLSMSEYEKQKISPMDWEQ